MSSIVRFLFSLAAAIAAAYLLAAALRRREPPSLLAAQLDPAPMAAASRNRSFVLSLHGLGDSGPANESIRTFSAPEFRLTKWAFPSAPNSPVSYNHMPHCPPPSRLLCFRFAPDSVTKFSSCMWRCDALMVRYPRATHERCALTLACVLFYPKTLGGGTVFSGWVPFGSSVTERISPEARKVYPGLGHSISKEELYSLLSWIKNRLKASQEKKN